MALTIVSIEPIFKSSFSAFHIIFCKKITKKGLLLHKERCNILTLRLRIFN